MDERFPDLVKLLRLNKGKRPSIPILSAEDAREIALCNWEVGRCLYISGIFTYAFSLHGCLTYDQQTFADQYSRVFALIDNAAFEVILKSIFPSE